MFGENYFKTITEIHEPKTNRSMPYLCHQQKTEILRKTSQIRQRKCLTNSYKTKYLKKNNEKQPTLINETKLTRKRIRNKINTVTMMMLIMIKLSYSTQSVQAFFSKTFNDTFHQFTILIIERFMPKTLQNLKKLPIELL